MDELERVLTPMIPYIFILLMLTGTLWYGGCFEPMSLANQRRSDYISARIKNTDNYMLDFIRNYEEMPEYYKKKYIGYYKVSMYYTCLEMFQECGNRDKRE